MDYIDLSYLDFKVHNVGGLLLKPYELVSDNYDVVHHKNLATLEQYRHVLTGTTIKSVFEIGVQNGGSLLLWNYMFNCKVVGIDVTLQGVADVVLKHLEHRDIHVHWADSYNFECVFDIATAEFPDGIDMVIDDGAHDIRAIKINLNNLLRCTKKLYIIEDWLALHIVHQHELFEYLHDIQHSYNMQYEKYPSMIVIRLYT